MDNSKPKLIAIVGATASGKTDYSINLASEIGGEIISADSRLVYKDFNIGTAKPTKDEMQGIPHYMIDVVEPSTQYSSGLYKKNAQKIIEDIYSRDKIPIIVGGTGLYIDILLKNFDLPQVEPNYELREELKTYSCEKLYEILKDLDEDALKFIYNNDKKKIIRAIEIIKATGNKLSLTRGIGEPQYSIYWIGKNFPREVLYERINKRVDKMLEQGLVDETKFLLSKYGRIKNITETIGYREICYYLDNKMTLDEAIELLKKNTRNYAKRQLTWFRRNEEIHWDYYPEKLKK